MNKKLIFTGGEPLITNDDLNRNTEADRLALFAVILGLSGAVDSVISGAAVTLDPLVDADVTAGYVWLNGEILQVDAATVLETQGTDLWEFQKVVTYDSLGDKTFNDAVPRQTWQKNRAILVNVAAIVGMDAVNAPTTKGEANFGIVDYPAEIGVWDMVASAIKIVAIPAGVDPEKIDFVGVLIYADNRIAGSVSSLAKSLEAGGHWSVVNTAGTWTINLERDTAGVFDSTLYDDAVGNRGRLIIRHRQ